MSCARAIREASGHTMVELVVALVILAVGVLAVAATIGVVSRMATASLLTARARFAAQARIEELLAMPSDRLSSGEWTSGDLSVRWQVTGGEPRQIVLDVRHALGPLERRDTLATLARSP